MHRTRVVRRTLVALAEGGTVYSNGSFFMNCQAMEMDQLVALAQRRGAWNWPNNCMETDYHCTIGSEMESIHTGLSEIVGTLLLGRRMPELILIQTQSKHGGISPKLEAAAHGHCGGPPMHTLGQPPMDTVYADTCHIYSSVQAILRVKFLTSLSVYLF